MDDHEKGRELFFLAQHARQQGHHAKAEAFLREALRHAPDRESIRTNLCGALIDQGKHDEALPLCRDLVRDFPQSAVGWHRLSVCQHQLTQPQDALASVDRCLALAPDNVDALCHKLALLLATNAADIALALCLDAVDRLPHEHALQTALGVIYSALRQFEPARDAHAAALAMAPDSADKRWNLALAQLMLGELVAGWHNMEARWHATAPVKVRYTGEAPRWDGKVAADGRRILIWVEQGLGDAIQFARYIPLVAAAGADVILQVPETLLPIMRALPIAADRLTLIAQGSALPAHQMHVPLMSVPTCLGEEGAIIPPPVRLAAPEERRAVWRQRIGASHRPRVGIMWQGNMANLQGTHRSMSLADLAAVLAMPLDFFCVSDTLADADRSWLTEHAPGLRTFQGRIRDFGDTACLVAQLDLLLSIDTSIAHLGPSLGVPTWVMLPWAADWRWGMGESNTPWYPESRLFRQRIAGEWQAPVAALHAALRQHFGLG